MSANGDNIWVASTHQVIPHIEVKLVRDEADRTALRDRIPAHIVDATIPI